MPPASVWRERAAAVLEAGSPAVVADGVVERWLTPGFAAAHPGVRGRLRSMLAETDAAGYAACCGAIGRMDLRADLPRIRAATLVVSGSDDPATPREHQALIAGAVRGARHETVGPAAHVAAVEQPAAVNELVLGHVLGARA
jgi:pimeloyl-ACP methyl ester carboxylesterase